MSESDAVVSARQRGRTGVLALLAGAAVVVVVVRWLPYVLTTIKSTRVLANVDISSVLSPSGDGGAADTSI